MPRDQAAISVSKISRIPPTSCKAKDAIASLSTVRTLRQQSVMAEIHEAFPKFVSNRYVTKENYQTLTIGGLSKTNDNLRYDIYDATQTHSRQISY